MLDRTVKKSIIINAPAAKLWKNITDPLSIKKFLFNTEVRSAWKKGQRIEFSGTWKGRDFQGRGEILEFDKEKKLEYTYYNTLTGLPDDPGNYCRVIYELDEQENHTVLSIIQTHIDSQDEYEQVSEYWQTVLEKLKMIVENEVAANQPAS